MIPLLPASALSARTMPSSLRRALAVLLNCSATLSLASGQSTGANQPVVEPGQGKIQTPLRRSGAGLAFIENRGQFDSDVKFEAKAGDKIIWFTSAGVVFDVTRPAADSPRASEPDPALFRRPGVSPANKPPEKSEGLVFSEEFTNGKASPKVEPSAPQPGIYNYFIGNDPKGWRTGVVSYSELLYRDVWPGIDVRFAVNGSDIEQEFLVHPGTDTSRIRVGYHGVKGLQIGKDGSLVVQTLLGPLQETAPRIYQEIDGRRTIVSGRYRTAGEFAYTFQVGSHNAAHALVIDPTLLFSTYVGQASATSYGQAIAVDPSGNTYMAGYTEYAPGYPTSTGVLQPSCPDGNCVGSSGVVTKLNALGGLSYSTYLGSPTGGDQARGIAVDANGEAYVVGLAQSGFPTTSNGFQANGCNASAFAAKLNSTGTALLYSTCLGAEGFAAENGPAGAFAVALDNNGRAYLTGSTADGEYSSPFPLTNGAIQSVSTGPPDAFVAVIDPSLSGSNSLVYSTLLGGEYTDVGQGIAVDAYGNAYITGATYSLHFPATTNAFQTVDANQSACPGNETSVPVPCASAFVAKINPNVSGPTGLLYSSYLGGPFGAVGGDIGYGIAVDSSGNAYVAGTTNSRSFPTTAGAFLTSGLCGLPYGFVTKMNAGGSGLVYSTYLGPTGGLGGRPCQVTGASGIALDSFSNAYIVGSTQSTAFPVTANAFQSTNPGGNSGFYDAFLTELSASGSSLIYSSYLGGSANDLATAVAIDAVGDAYLTGTTSSLDFPVTPFAFQPVYSGNGGPYCGGTCGDVFITKFPLGAPGNISITGIEPNAGGNAGTVSPQIVGRGLHAGVTAQLNCGGSSIVGTNVTIGTGGQLVNTTFDLTATSPGTCDVVVTNPDGTSATLAGGFTVQQGGAPSVLITLTGIARELLGPDYSVPPIEALYMVTASNLGNIDTPAALVSVTAQPGFSFTSSNPPLLASADATTLWGMTGLAAGQSQVFLATATALSTSVAGVTSLARASTLASSDSVPVASFTECLLYDVGGFDSCLTQNLPSSCTFSFSPLCDLHYAGCASAVAYCALTSPGFLLTALCYVGAADVCATAADDCVTCSGGGSDLLPCIQNNTTLCLPWQGPISAAQDPNSLGGPNGVGGQQWMSGNGALSYAVSFSNEPTAPVPAQQVVITEPLGANVNLSGLSLQGITIPNGANSIQVAIPPGSFNPAVGINEFMTSADLRPTQNLLVGVDAKLNPASQTLTWTFSSIDPATGQSPVNPMIGFLPPGAGASAAFSVTPALGITTGSQVSEQATVVFDANSPMSTSAWINTIDNTAPVSQVSALPSTSACPAFRVSWSGSDIGSGLQGFTIYVSDTGGPFTAWISNTTAASADYQGAVGHTYAFYSIATDLVGNMEGTKTSAEALTSVTAAGPCGPPSLSGQLSNVSQSGTTVTGTLTLTNTGFTAAQTVNINQMTFRTLSGSGTVTLASPALPAAEGPLAIGAQTTVPLTLNVPTTVIRFSLTESGNLQDGSGNNYNYSMAQTVIP